MLFLHTLAQTHSIYNKNESIKYYNRCCQSYDDTHKSVKKYHRHSYNQLFYSIKRCNKNYQGRETLKTQNRDIALHMAMRVEW